MAGLRPLPPEAMVWGRVAGGTWGIERLMDVFDARGMKATFFVSTLEELHHGPEHVRQVCSAILARGHDAQLHLHPNWWKGDFARKRLTDYSLAEQTELVGLAKEAYRRACGAEPLAHRAGGLLMNADTLSALEANAMPLDASGIGKSEIRNPKSEILRVPNAPRRLGPIIEVPVTTFAQLPLGALRRHFDLKADSLSELKFVADRAVVGGVTAVCLLMHSFSLLGRNREGTDFWPAEAECRKLERFLDYVRGRDDVEAVTFSEFARRIEARPELLDGPELEATAGVVRTWQRSCDHFRTGWKSKA
ncbi:MAG: hypothetical protein FJ291_08050, partial [Planctomycetes bacterium]|nr:hypothetical protein [Planctomycetota bacterium]